MSHDYTVDDGFRLQATFTVSDVNTDPTTIRFKIKDPDGVITTYTFGTDAEVVKSAVGVYYMDITVTAPGNWWYKIIGAGAVIAAVEGTFVGRQSQFD